MFTLLLRLCCATILSIGLFVGQSIAQSESERIYPNNKWSHYESSEAAGFITKRLAKVEKFYNKQEFAGLLIVKDGAIAVDWGENERRFLVHSIRKSMLSALYGIHSSDIDLQSTLMELEINDKNALTAQERSATLLDVLSSRSGIYLPAAAEGGQMIENRPERGQHDPGSHWWYNNWDFNVATSIYTQVTGEEVAYAFGRHFAQPLQMQDFREYDGYFVRAESDHQAVQFRMSSRDLARLGLLYARNGNWRGQQIIPRKWIQASTQAVSKTGMEDKNPPYYGYMWWVEEDGSYSARGAGGHVLAVYPERDMVVVLRTNTYLEHSVSDRAIKKILNGIISASEGQSASSPTLTVRNEDNKVLQELPSRYQHKQARFTLDNGHIVTLNSDDQRLLVNLGTGELDLRHLKDNRFIILDREEPLEISLNRNEQITEIRTPRLFYLRAMYAAQQGDLDNALDWVKDVIGMMPTSALAYTNMAKIYIAMGDISAAKDMLNKALSYEPNH